MNLEKLKQKQMKLKRGGKKIMKIGMKRERGITLIALVVTIVVLLILAGVSINALFGNNGIIEKAKEAQNKMDKATENDQKEINELTNWLDNQVNGTTGGGTTGEDDNPSTTPKISRLIGTVVDKNTKAEDAYGNKITIPKGFKVVAHGTVAGSATYTYSGDNIPAVQDGIVIENGTDSNQFVWVPVGTINNKSGDSKGATSTITLGRYSDFAMTNGAVASGQPVQVASVENCTREVSIGTFCKELCSSSSSENTTARNLAEFISITLEKGGYYIARFEASGTTSKIESKYNQKVLGNITQPTAANLAREMYGEIKENDKLVYASDLVNSYAWDTAIIFIQTYSIEIDASSYASKNKSTSFANTGISNDKYCNIWDMSGNAKEWTTEYSSDSDFVPCTFRGGYYITDFGQALAFTSARTSTSAPDRRCESLRPLLYVN